MKRHKAYMPAGHLGTKHGRTCRTGFHVSRRQRRHRGRETLRRQPSLRFSRPAWTPPRPRAGEILLHQKTRLPSYAVPNPCRTRSRKSKALYSQEDIDFIAAYIAPHQAWYVIPVEALGKSKTIYTLPGRQKYANWRTLRDLSRSLAPVEGTRKRANRRKQTKNASESWSHSEFIRLNLWLS